MLNTGNLNAAMEAAEREKTAENYSTTLMHELIALHPFLDGNKRTAIVAFKIAMKSNRAKSHLTDQELEELAVHIAMGLGNLRQTRKRMRV